MSARRTWLRAGLIFLAAAQGLTGIVQLLLPRGFYDDFPAPDHPWVAMLPPYNEHLTRDVGAASLAYVFVLGAAAITLDRRTVRTALIANLVFTVPHFVFHATHLDHMPTGDAIAQTLALASGVLLPTALFVLAARPETPGSSADDAPRRDEHMTSGVYSRTANPRTSRAPRGSWLGSTRCTGHRQRRPAGRASAVSVLVMAANSGMGSTNQVELAGEAALLRPR